MQSLRQNYTLTRQSSVYMHKLDIYASKRSETRKPKRQLESLKNILVNLEHQLVLSQIEVRALRVRNLSLSPKI